MVSSDYAKNYYYKHRVKILEDQKRRRQDEEYRQKLKKYYKDYYRKNRLKILEQAKLRRRLGEFYSVKTYKEMDRTLKITKGVFTLSFN